MCAISEPKCPKSGSISEPFWAQVPFLCRKEK
jgi:hypothetical protein